MSNYITVVPAWGSDYKSQKAVKDAWNAGKDFIVQDMFSQWNGKPVNKEDAERYAPGSKFMVRYDRLTKVVQVTK